MISCRWMHCKRFALILRILYVFSNTLSISMTFKVARKRDQMGRRGPKDRQKLHPTYTTRRWSNGVWLVIWVGKYFISFSRKRCAVLGWTVGRVCWRRSVRWPTWRWEETTECSAIWCISYLRKHVVVIFFLISFILYCIRRPSTSWDKVGTHYFQAEHAGLSVGCHQYNDRCPKSILDFISVAEVYWQIK